MTTTSSAVYEYNKFNYDFDHSHLGSGLYASLSGSISTSEMARFSVLLSLKTLSEPSAKIAIALSTSRTVHVDDAYCRRGLCLLHLQDSLPSRIKKWNKHLLEISFLPGGFKALPIPLGYTISMAYGQQHKQVVACLHSWSRSQCLVLLKYHVSCSDVSSISDSLDCSTKKEKSPLGRPESDFAYMLNLPNPATG